MPLAALLLQLDSSRVQHIWDFASFTAAIVLLTVAVAAIAVFFFRRGTQDLTLVYFSTLCALYGIRLLFRDVSFRAMFSFSRPFWVYGNWFLTCIVIIPCGLFLYQLIDTPRVKKIFVFLLYFQAAFALFGIVAAALGANLNQLWVFNNIAVLAAFTGAALFLIYRIVRSSSREPLSLELRAFSVGFFIWFFVTFQANLLVFDWFSGRDVEFIGFLAFVASLGYISAHRVFANEQQLHAINKELEIARQIQFSTLPQSVPTLPGLDVAVRYVPMTAVAGDFYDFLVIDDRHVGILIADVTGHGVPAALIASMLKVAFAGQSANASDPARVLTGLNVALCGKFEAHFITAAYLYVDLDRRILRYSAAGHPPLMVASRTCAAPPRQIEHNGLMLGMFSEAEYSSLDIPFSPDDRCMLYTDGIFESKNPAQEEFGLSRCLAQLQSQCALPPADFIDVLLDQLAAFSGRSIHSQDDDITLLLLDLH